MKKNVIKIALGLLIFSFTACNTDAKKTEETTNTEQTTDAEETTVSFKTAENYFVKNTVKEPVPVKITTQKEFDNYFGMAATMGENGKPTPIDFSKEYIIVADYADTNKQVEMTPVSLEQKGGDLVFNYTVTEGEDAGFTSHPFLMLIVSNDTTGNVVLQKN